MQLFDTHCHIHEAWHSVNGPDATAGLWAKAGNPDPAAIIARARQANVHRMLCVGTTLPDSKLAVEFVQEHSECWATIGLHPHEAKEYAGDAPKLAEFAALVGRPKLVGIGECGLDYFYEHSGKADQEKILRFQIELALRHDKPMVFHVRDAFRDFWKVFDSYNGIRGVIHSFSATRTDLDEVLARGLFVGLNGIMTFTKNGEQLAAAKAVPIDRLLLETDAPFLTPAPYRGTICEPKHIRVTAEFLATLRGEPITLLAESTTKNARALFGI